MQKICALLAFLACICHGRRVLSSMEESESLSSPLNALERVLLSSNLPAAFSPSNPTLSSARGMPLRTAARKSISQNPLGRVESRLPRMAEDTSTESAETETELSPKEPAETESDLLKSLLALVPEPEKLQARMDEVFSNFTQEEMREVSSRADSEEPWKQLMQAHQRANQRSMERGKDKLEDLIDTGDIQKLDAKIIKLVKTDQADTGFILVLNQNIAAAQSEAGDGSDHDLNTKLNILTHISTRVQEELEKKLKPETGVLHKLMRTEDVPLRGRILSHYLLPQKEIKLPDGQVLPVENPTQALVEPLKFSEAVIEVCKQLRSVNADGDLIMGMLEDVRQIAIEADTVIRQGYPEDVVVEFREALAPSFTGVRAAAKEREAAATQ